MTDTPPHAESQQKGASRPAELRVVGVLIVFLLGVVFYSMSRGPGDSAPAPTTPPAVDMPPQGFVELSWSAPGAEADPVETPWRPGLTVVEATRSAAGVGGDPWHSRWRGEGRMAFLTELSGIANQGTEGRNWLFSVNGERSPEGAGAVELSEGDSVLWEFALYE